MCILILDYYFQTFTSKTEESTRRHFSQETTDDEGPPPSTSRERYQGKKPSQHKPRSPKQSKEERSWKSSYQSSPGHSPFCQDTYYSMRDESDDSTDTSKIHRKVEVVSETHTKVMSSKKSETYKTSTSTPQQSQPPTEKSQTKPKDVTRGEYHITERQVQSPKEKIVVPPREVKVVSEMSVVSQMNQATPLAGTQPIQKYSRNIPVMYEEVTPQQHTPKKVSEPARPSPKVPREPIRSVPKVESDLKSTRLVRDVQIDSAPEDIQLEPFPFEVRPERLRKPKGDPPPTPKKFVPGEFRESDYDSEFDGKVKPKWTPSGDEETQNVSFSRVEPVLHHRESQSKERTPTPPSKFDHPPKFEGPPRPKVEFPDSESEVEQAPKPAVHIRPRIKRVLKTTQTAPAPPVPQREASPVLQPEPVAEEGYIPPPPPPVSYQSDSVGLESTKITTISDTSQFHRRFITQQHTTRVFKLSDVKVAAPPPQTETVVSEKKITREPLPMAVDAPPPEALPFTPIPKKSRKERVIPLAKPSKFSKGDFRESDYESEDDSKIRPKWQPVDSDVDEPSYTKVQPPTPAERSRVRSLERPPAPPSEFDVPPESGGPLRPSIDLSFNKPPFKIDSSPKNTEKLKIFPKTKLDLSEPANAPAHVPRTVQVEPAVNFVSQVQVESRRAPPVVKEVQSIQQRPYTEIIEKTEKIFTKKNVVEEVKEQKNRRETITTTVQYPEDVPAQTTTTVNGYHATDAVKPTQPLEEFPFKPSPPRPKKSRGAPPPTPRVFVKGDFSESEYDSELDNRIRPKWNPTDSETDDYQYKKVPAPRTDRPRPAVQKDRTPTPPSKFDVPPVQGGPLRPEIKMLEKVVIEPLEEPVYPQRPPADEVLLEPGAAPSYGYIPNGDEAPKRKNTFVIEENFKVTMNRSDDDYLTLSESDYTDSDFGKYIPRPLPGTDVAPRKEAAPSTTFLKGGLPAAPGRVLKATPQWPPKPAQDGVTHEKPPHPTVPQSPSKFGKPTKPFFAIDSQRRESLEDYSIPRFPKVEFKPYDESQRPAINGHPQPSVVQTTTQRKCIALNLIPNNNLNLLC